MGSEAWELERRYSVPGALDTRGLEPPASEDLHAWSIYRQNLNSDFTDSALGSAEKSPLPYGNFQLRDSTVQSILRHPRYGPKSPLANNSYTYLKFGLPRVLPPSSRNRDGSSGYDSSEEGRRVSHAGVPVHSTSIMRSARSDPDFRHVHAVPREQTHSQLTVARDHPRLRSASEANLLQSAIRTNRRHSIAPIDPGYITHGHPGILGPEGYTLPLRPVPCLQHPHLQLRGVEASGSNGLPLLRGITLEAGAAELLAIMATTEKEGTQIVETIAGRRRIKRGDILLNGRSVSARTLRSRVAYLPTESGLSPGLTAQQTLSFYMLVRGGRNTTALEAEAVLQELGLEATKHCLVNTLTTSEARRLALACRLLQDSHVLALDRPTHGLDIFDAFFLVEYLRQWASRGQRLVVLTLHPPTYEILTMVSRVTLTSGGRIMYSGLRRDMLPYFALAEFPNNVISLFFSRFSDAGRLIGGSDAGVLAEDRSSRGIGQDEATSAQRSWSTRRASALEIRSQHIPADLRAIIANAHLQSTVDVDAAAAKNRHLRVAQCSTRCNILGRCRRVKPISDIPGAGVRHVGATPGAGREPDVAVEPPRRRSAVPDAAAPHLHLLRARVQVYVSGGFARRRICGRDESGWRCHSTPKQSAVVVPADQPDAVVAVAPAAASAQKREHEQAGQLQAQADPAAGHHHSGRVRAARRRVSPPRGRPRQGRPKRTRRVVAGRRRGRHGPPDRSGLPVRQVRDPEEAQKRPEQTLILSKREESRA